MCNRLMMIGVVLAMSIAASASRAAEWLAPSEKQITPILLGSPLPAAGVRTLAGKSISLTSVVNGKPAVLVFYRGGWCPYCNLQLSQLQQIEGDLEGLGYQVIAVSPDTPEQLHQTLEQHKLQYTLVSDDKASAMKAFGVGYKVEGETLRQYHSWGIDISQGALPVPSIFIVDSDGVIQFSYAHPDFRIRVPGQVVLAAARAIAQREHKLHPAGS